MMRGFFNAEGAEVRKRRKFQGNVSQQIPRFPSFRAFRVEKKLMFTMKDAKNHEDLVRFSEKPLLDFPVACL